MEQATETAERKKMPWYTKVFLALFGLVVVIATFGEPPEETAAAPTDVTDGGSIAAAVEPPPDDGLTGPQRNARRSAEDYIAMKGFSRAGLIEQLSSEYGSGYEEADATAAVDSMNIDWNEQAAREAKSYLEMTGFSCNGLIEQLSSEYGSKYTAAQARYGAEQAGAC